MNFPSGNGFSQLLTDLQNGQVQGASFTEIRSYQKQLFDTSLKAWQGQQMANDRMNNMVSDVKRLVETIGVAQFTEDAISALPADDPRLQAWNQLSPDLQQLIFENPADALNLQYRDQYRLGTLRNGYDLYADGMLLMERESGDLYKETTETKTYPLNKGTTEYGRASFKSVARMELSSLLFGETVPTNARIQFATPGDEVKLSSFLAKNPDGFTVGRMSVGGRDCCVTMGVTDVASPTIPTDSSSDASAMYIEYTVNDPETYAVRKWNSMQHVLWEDQGGVKVPMGESSTSEPWSMVGINPGTGVPYEVTDPNDPNLVGGYMEVKVRAGAFAESYTQVAGQVGAMMDGFNAEFNIPDDARYDAFRTSWSWPEAAEYVNAWGASAFSQECVVNGLDRTAALIQRFAAMFPDVQKWCDGYTFYPIVPGKGPRQKEVIHPANFPESTVELDCQRSIGYLLNDPRVKLIPFTSDPSSLVLYHSFSIGDVFNIPQGQWCLKSDGTFDSSAYAEVMARVTIYPGCDVDIPLVIEPRVAGSIFVNPDTGVEYATYEEALKPMFDLCDQLDNTRAQVTSVSYAGGELSLELTYRDESGTLFSTTGILDLSDGCFGIIGGSNYPSISAFITANIPSDTVGSQLDAFLNYRFGIGVDMQGVNFRYIMDSDLPSGTKRYGFSLPIDTKTFGSYDNVNDYIPLIFDIAADGGVTVYLAQNSVSSDIGKELTVETPLISVGEMFGRLSQIFDLSQLQHLAGKQTVGFALTSWNVGINGIVDFSLGFSTGANSPTSMQISGQLDLSQAIADPSTGLLFENPQIAWENLRDMYQLYDAIPMEKKKTPDGTGFRVFGDATLINDQFSFQVYLQCENSMIDGVATHQISSIDYNINDPSGCVLVTDSSGQTNKYASIGMWIQEYYSERWNPTAVRLKSTPWIQSGSFSSSYDPVNDWYTFQCTTTPNCDGGGTFIEGHQDPTMKVVIIDRVNGVTVNQGCGSLLAYLECLHGTNGIAWNIDSSSGYDSDAGCYNLVFDVQMTNAAGKISIHQYRAYIDSNTGLVSMISPSTGILMSPEFSLNHYISQLKYWY